MVKGVYVNGQVVLRWAPQDIPSWRHGNAHGFKLERKTLRVGEAVLSQAVGDSSFVLLASNLSVMPESQWETFADSNSLAGVAAGAIYGDSLDVLPPDGGGLLQIYNKSRELENRYGFSLLAADQDLSVAKAMGLAFVDSSAQPGRVYLYFLTALGGVTTIGGATAVETDALSSTPKPPKPKVVAMDKALVLMWENDGSVYASFSVERAVGVNGAFSKLNNTPLVYASTSDHQGEPMSYIDSLADNITVYVYRLRGRTPFGTESEPSDTVQAQGRPAANT